MKLKLVNLLDSTDVLNQLTSERFNDGITSYKIARNIKLINAELALFNEARQKLIEKHEGIKKGDAFEIPANNRDNFTKELNELLGQEVEINILTINPEKLSGHSPTEFLAIDWMLDLDAK